LRTDHAFDLGILLVKLDLVYAAEKFLQVRLDDKRILSLAQNFQKVVVTDEVKPRKFRPFLFQIVVERLLAHVELS